MFTFNQTIIAHRGAAAYAPENTMDAFNQAYLRGARWIEFDVMLAACGTPIVFHDDTLMRTTRQSGSPGDFPYTVLATFEAGSWFSPFAAGARIPSLAEVLVFLKQTGLSANLEIKPLPGQVQATVEAVVKLVEADFKNEGDRILFSSFSLEAMHHLRKISPHCALGLLMDDFLPHWEAEVAHLKPCTLHFNKDRLDAKAVSRLKRLHKPLLAYTVNSRDEALHLFSLGVDSVFSDYPDLLSR